MATDRTIFAGRRNRMPESDHQRARLPSRFEHRLKLLSRWNQSVESACSGAGRGERMLEGFNKRDFAIFAAALLVAGALTVGAVDFVIYHYVFQDTSAAPILAK